MPSAVDGFVARILRFPRIRLTRRRRSWPRRGGVPTNRLLGSSVRIRGGGTGQIAFFAAFAMIAAVGAVVGNNAAPPASDSSSAAIATAPRAKGNAVASDKRSWANTIGRASVTDGDTIEIRGERIRIHGVDAPESGQTCGDPRGEPWRCGQKAALALADWLEARTVECRRTNTDRYGRTVARCSVGAEDVGAWLVSNGWARAFTRYSREYLDEERLAKNSKLGIWRGKHVAPWDWRAQERVPRSRTSAPLPLVGSTPQPSRCAIKGNINARGECIYHVPGSRHYNRTKISPSKGEQYFCTVADAVAAGCRAPRG